MTIEYKKHAGIMFDTIRLMEDYFDNPNDKIDFILNGNIISENMFIFFYSSSEKVSFASKYFILDNDYFNICDIRKSNIFLQNDLFQLILKHYINDFEIISYNNLSPDYLYFMLTIIDIPDKIKLQIMHFNFNKNFYYDLLTTEFEKVYNLIKTYTENIKESILNNLSDFEMKLLPKFISSLDRNFDKTIYTISSVESENLSISYDENILYLNIGINKANDLVSTNNKNNIDLSFIAKVLSDEFRIEVLNLLRKNGEMNTSEIAEHFNKGLTATFYHLNLMQEAKILITKNQGRKVIYKVNIDFFDKLGTYIKSFSNNDAISF